MTEHDALWFHPSNHAEREALKTDLADTQKRLAAARMERNEAVALLRELEWSLNETATRTGRCPFCAKVNGRAHDPTCRLGAFLGRMKGRG